MLRVMDVSPSAGAVAGVSHLRNPVLAARLVMEESPHVLLTGAGAERFAFEHGMAPVRRPISGFPQRRAISSCWTPVRRA